ncbi:MAG: Triosephosphate isomerase [Candidatus Anoxychlamydiales bacterium]|nr:Triosephosphate isomerase [Candidatus Anoxychlamydiales bacterium]
MEKNPIIAGNWKMYKTIKETKDFLEKLSSSLNNQRANVYIAPSFISLFFAKEIAKDTKIKIGSQNMHYESEGAFTGEISPGMLKEIDMDFVILGHSERRNVFKEDNSLINKKVLSSLENNIQPILCIGETEKERDSNSTNEVLEDQLTKNLLNVSKTQMKNVIIAYEPVWAIGTGKTATPDIAENAHLYIRKVITKLYDKDIANSTYILYGGSVKPDNIEILLGQHNIDGALIGGASLKIDTFLEIINKS